MDDRHGATELEIFRRFAMLSSHRIVEGTVRKRQPPQPDILCELDVEGPLAFELVQLIDQGIASRLSNSTSLHSEIERQLALGPTDLQIRITSNFGNALVHVTFRTGATLRRRKNSIPRLLRWLSTLPDEFEGEGNIQGFDLEGVIHGVSIRRGSFVGPYFDIEGGGFFEDPTSDLVLEKLLNQYQVATPLELLAYYELQPVLPDVVWLPQLEESLRAKLSVSQFRRVWVYDTATNTIKFVYPSLS